MAQRWLRIWRCNSSDVFTLSYDACKLDEDLIINEKGCVTGCMNEVQLTSPPLAYRTNSELYRRLWEQQIASKNLITHAFVFMLTPVTEDRGYVIHVEYANTGSATPQVLRCIKEIPELLNDKIRIAFSASDSDNKYRLRFNQQFESIYAQFSYIYVFDQAKGEIAGPGNLYLPMVMYCNDIPHILKWWRSRLICSEHLFLSCEREKLFCTGESVSISLNAKLIRDLNGKIPLSAFRVGSIPSMDDSYPLMIFTVETFLAAWDAQRLDAAIYLLPAVCAQVVFRNKKITRVIRLKVAYLGWCLCIYYYSYLEDCSELKFRRPIISKELLVDLCNALLCQIYGMGRVQKAYRTSKISSTMSEHFFARMRRTMGSDQSVENFTNVLLRNVICDLGESPGPADLHHPKRVFDSALCEEGISCVSAETAIEVRDFVAALFRRSNVVLSQRAKHVKVFECSNEHDLDGSSIIRLLRELVVDDTPQRFTIHAGQSRARRIYGRSIMSRFSTAAKAESVCDPGAKPSISSSPHGDTSGGWEK